MPDRSLFSRAVPAELKLFRRLNTPARIQAYLNGLGYDADPECRSPRYVIREGKAHCFEGALLASAVLRFHGYEPLIVDMTAKDDDDHVIAVYRKGGYWGAVAKSNYTVLRSRQPVYRTIRELVFSYFDFYFNTAGRFTLRSYSAPVRLRRFDAIDWMFTEKELECIGDHLFGVRHYPAVSRAMAGRLERVSPDVLKAGLLGSSAAGLFKPGRRQS